MNKSKCSILIISSQFVKDGNFVMKENEFKEIENINNKSKLCQAILNDWKNWLQEDFFLVHKILADPVTLYFGVHQENILSTKPVRLIFNGIDQENESIIEEFRDMNMLSENSNQFFSIDYSIKTSNVHLIENIKNEEEVRKFIVNSIIEELK